jgi:hypothetical protein
MIQHLRMKYGLRWMKWHPPIPWRHIAVIVLCLTTYLAVAQIDNLSERIKEMEKLAHGNETYAKVFFDCMSAGANNEVGGFILRDAGKAFECAIREL